MTDNSHLMLKQREILIEKLSDTMDPDNARALVDEVFADLDRALALYTKKAHDWNAEADKYLAQRDALTVRIAELEHQGDEIKALQQAIASLQRSHEIIGKMLQETSKLLRPE